MGVEMIEVSEILGEPKVVPITAQPTPKPLSPSKEAEYSAILAAMQVAAKILAVRFLLSLSLVGSFILAVTATENGSPQSAYVLLLYALVTTLPLTIIELWRKIS